MNRYVCALGQAAKQLGDATACQRVLQTAVDVLLAAFDGELALAWLRQEHRKTLLAHGRASLAAAPLESADAEILRSWAEEVTRDGAPFIHDLPERRSISSEWPPVDGARSVGAIPLVLGGDSAGGLFCLSRATPTDDAREAITTLGRMVSIALERASLMEPPGLAGIQLDDEVVTHQHLFPDSQPRDASRRARLSALREEEQTRPDRAGMEGRSGPATTDDLEHRAVAALDQTRLYQETLKIAIAQGAILRQMAEGIVLADSEGQITFVNDASRRLLGVDAPRMTLEDFLRTVEVLTPDGRTVPWEERSLARALVTGESSLSVDRRVRRPDGTEIITEGSAVPVVAADGTRIGAVLTFRDVTQQRTLERQRDEFLSAIAHDLKSPLTTIRGFTQLLQLRAGRSESVEAAQILEGLARIDATTERMTLYVEELLDTTRVQMGRELELSPGRVDLVGLVRRVAADFQESALAHEITVETCLEELIGTWDANRMERVLTNLLSNAVKYSPGGGQIVLSVHTDGDRATAVVAVRDEGLGIPRADLPLIFDRFHRAQNVPRGIPGTGIGLTAVRQIVEQQGGTVSVESVEGEGSTFTVRLPLPDTDGEDG